MSYNTNVPVASQTPSLFPAQGTANFTVLKQTIGRDHIFNNTVASGDNTGYHKQVTLKNRSNPSSLPTGLNAMLYSQSAAPNASQLMYWDGDLFNQLTPVGLVIPMAITGTASLAVGGSTVAFANPGYKYAGSAWGITASTSNFSWNLVLRSGSNSVTPITSQGGSIFNRPVFSFNGGGDLLINLNASASAPQVVVWVINITKVVA